MVDKNYCALPIFKDLSAAQLDALDAIFECKSYAPEEMVFAQDQSAGHLYFLLEGEILIHYKPYDGPPLIVARIMPGGVFGWSTALGHSSHTSAAQAAQLCKVVRLSRDTMTGLSLRSPEAGAVLLEKLAGAVVRQTIKTGHQYPNFDQQMQEHVVLSLQKLFEARQELSTR
ncbi:MAG: cyclic nucleotide-binding domain-containing protein [Anaerolineaceae bacterium]|jgi:CRP-like cAMP-binding protein|nr:cyclic nucleotide-binding domain-containing protein [Anaerolineaceae bacterium]